MKKQKLEKQFTYKGYECAIIGQARGHRCGYICIPREHPAYELHYDDINIDVHGGLTYSESSNNYPIESKEPKFWIGFDCAHFNDGVDLALVEEIGYLKTRELRDVYMPSGVVRTLEYVQDELIRAVDQLEKMV